MSFLDQINTFIAVIDAGSFTHASKKMGISAAAVSKQINQLESELGISLIDRSTRHLIITDMGQHFYQKFKNIKAQIDDIKQFAESTQKKLKGQLCIYSLESLSNYCLLPFLAEFMRLHPQLEIKLQHTDHIPDFNHEYIDVFLGGYIDLMDSQQKDLVAIPILTYQFIYCASPEYIAQYGEPNKKMNQHCYITYTLRIEDLPKDEKTQQMLFTPKNILKVNSSYSALQAVLKGIGIAKLPSFMVGEYLKKKQLKQILHQEDSVSQKSYLFYKKQTYTDIKIATLKKFLLKKISSIERFC